MIQRREARLGQAGHGRDAVVPVLRARTRSRRHASRSRRDLLADTWEKAAGVDRVLTMDLHTGQIQGFFTIPSIT